MPSRETHPVCVQLRELRQAEGLSLKEFEERFGFSAMVVGAYERGDRIPPLTKIDALFGAFGYHLVAQPIRPGATRTSRNMIADLRTIADQLEKVEASKRAVG